MREPEATVGALGRPLGALLTGALGTQLSGAGPLRTAPGRHPPGCRRATGAQAVAFITVPAKSFSFTRGEPTAFRTDTAATRTFCGRCGTSLTYVGDNRKHEIDIHTATLADPEAFPPDQDVFPEEKLSWVALSAPAPGS